MTATFFTRILLPFLTFQLVVCANGGKCKYNHLASTHTMCVYSEEVACKAIQRGVNSSDVKVIVDSHNTIRSNMAIQNSASNMLKMQWDSELAQIAQRLVDQCKYQTDCFDCRAVDRFDVGQNVHRNRKTSQSTINITNASANWKRIIESWATPKTPIPNSVIKSYIANNAYITSSQIIWAESQFVGCGFISFVNNNQEIKLYVCNYGPAGNIIDDPIYKVGTACSDCQKNSICSSNLCT